MYQKCVRRLEIELVIENILLVLLLALFTHQLKYKEKDNGTPRCLRHVIGPISTCVREHMIFPARFSFNVKFISVLKGSLDIPNLQVKIELRL